MRILLSQFGGIAPRYSPEKLPEAAAQVAENTDLHTGSIAPFKQNGAATALTTTKPILQTAYLWRVNNTEYWFRFQHEVELARSPIADDENKRIYWTGDNRMIDANGLAYPQMSYTPIAYTGGTDYPINSYRLGVPIPSMPVNITPSGATLEPELAEFRSYVRTYVTDLEEEGPPCEPSPQLSVGPGQSVVITELGLSAGDGTARNITKQRIYRTSTGNYGAAFQFVVELAIADSTYTDSKNSDELVEIMPSTDWLEPPVGLRGLRLMANGVMIGFVGNEICFSEPYLPHAWPPRYRLTVDYPIVAIGSYDTTIVVATQGRPFIITGSHPESMSQRELDLIEPCVSMRSMVSMGHGVVYASSNGLVYVTGAGARLITEGIVTRNEWVAFNPDTIRACEYRQQYMAYYGDDAGTGGGFFMNPLAPNTGIIQLEGNARAVHRDPLNEDLYLLDWSKNIAKFEGGASPLQAVWRSRVIELDRPSSFTALRVETVRPETTEIRIYSDDVLHSTTVITDNKPVRLPRMGRSRRIEIEVRTTGDIRSVAIAESVSEL